MIYVNSYLWEVFKGSREGGCSPVKKIMVGLALSVAVVEIL